jgi:hypothetical protein
VLFNRKKKKKTESDTHYYQIIHQRKIVIYDVLFKYFFNELLTTMCLQV